MKRKRICALLTAIMLIAQLLPAGTGRMSFARTTAADSGGELPNQAVMAGSPAALHLSAPSALLMEASTGQIIYENSGFRKLKTVRQCCGAPEQIGGAQGAYLLVACRRRHC